MPTPSAFYEGYSYPPAADHHDDGFGARPTGSSQQSSLRRSHASQSSQASGYGYSYGVPMDEYPAINRRPSFDEGDEEPLTRADDMVEPQDMASSLFPPSRPLPDVPGQNSLRSALRRPTSAFPFGETVNNAHMFRTTSLVSTHVPPQVEQPLRSRTNAEEPRRTQRSSYVPNFDLTLSTHASPLDLPTIGARKFAPGKLGAQDFKKCSEPWAMSGIMSWLAQTVSPEQYAELKEADVLEALVALFTHKVPTMNIADAEGLGGHFISQMYAQGRLVKSEEWVSIVSGKMEGVIYQLTGTGCYSPRLHEHVEPGRCYSRLCQRTLKKVNLQGPPAREMESWEVFYNLSRSDWENADKKELQRQNVLHEIVQTEERYMRQINVLRKLYRDQLANAEPSIITPERKTEFLKEVFGRIDAVKRANEDYLLPQLKYRQEEQGPWVVGFSDIFRQWIRKARTAYLDYAAGFPAANLLVRQELQRNLDFRAFIERASKDERSSRLQWDTYLKAPITRLQRYGLLLESVLKCMKEESTEKKELKIAWEEVKKVTLECDARVAEMQRKADLKDLATRLVLRPAIRESVKLNLDHYRRELVYRGDLQRNSEKKMAWLDSHVLLFDHYLVLAKLTDRRTYDVSRPPIPMDLLVLESTNEPLIQKSSYVRGITSVAAPGTSPVPTVMQNGPVTTLGESDKILYPFKIKHVGQHGHTYTLLASSENSRREWCQNIIKAKMKRAAALQAQNAEPFRLRIMADSAFAPPTMTTGLAGGKAPTIANTPLDRAIKETEQRFQGTSLPGPVCRARVNCATSFLVPQVGKLEPKRKVAVGTDFGVFVSDYDNLRGWRKAIQLSSVTQIAVLEDFNLFLLIAEKVLIAYHLDTICYDDRENVSAPSSTRKAPQRLSGSRDVGFFVTGRMKDRMLVIYKKRENLNSVFKVLEPIYQKTSSYQTSRFNLFRSQTEFFRDYDEFYIPTECSGVRIFRSSLSVATSRGFEVMTLEKKMPWTVPDTAPPHVAGIAAKIRNQRALTMLRLSDEEFLLVYTHCAIYMNQHGEINRSVQVDFEGAAQSATLYGDYLVLFDSNFVEIRNAHNGRLKQVVHGRDVRCLDDGSGEGGTVKFTMLHPDRADRTQLVLELVLNVM
ncbi:hypothetical protein K470DRAFT_213719 [Piedraia hortae CBS 480.64]|uniref:Rho guanyl nucleotide exchange factor n=1 Tax=Piedraia hortae CBS 480.64 TaxID=1314780 RepID=A0A6A7C3B3_9PEZI|nr:hypothetical protein K470DRAFT_213719 [Piedraia hortae CBS 480.64]